MILTPLPLWLRRSGRCQQLLVRFEQPMTPKQASRRTLIPWKYCSDLMLRMSSHDAAYCLNPLALRSRLYWLTELGRAYQSHLRRTLDLPPLAHTLDGLDWSTVGWLCFGHRSTILKTLEKPMRPAEIKRRARMQNSDLCMNVNNVIDILQLFLRKGIVVAEREGKSRRPRYRLTPIGRALRSIVQRVTA